MTERLFTFYIVCGRPIWWLPSRQELLVTTSNTVARFLASRTYSTSFTVHVFQGLLDQIDHKDLGDGRRLFSIDGFPITDDVILYDQSLPSGFRFLVGEVRNDDQVIDVAVIDEPVTFLFGCTVVGAVVLLCLAKLGVTALLTDRADARRIEHGQRTRIVIDGTTGGEVSFKDKIKAKLRCRLRVEILDADNKVIESHLLDEEE